VETPLQRPQPAGPNLHDLAEEWLAARLAGASRAQQAKGHSERARRGDLGRWCRLLVETGGVSVDWTADLSLEDDGVRLSVADLSVERLQACLLVGRERWSDLTVARMLSTLRTFTNWGTRRGHLASDPCADDELQLAAGSQRRPKGLTDLEIDALRSAAAAPAGPGVRRFWPARDLAIIEFLDGTGIRASELCAIQARDIDWTTERPLLRIDEGKGNKNREVPLPSRTVQALHVWTTERAANPKAAEGILESRNLFIQNSGRPATTGWLDQLLRTLADRAGVRLPDGAVAHAFRHTYGLRAAIRGVPTNLLSQLLGHQDPKTTAIYTHAASRNLIAALDDAGIL
jgi:site-specific recombinase XerD